MAKMNMKQRELKREKTVARYAEKRKELKTQAERAYVAGDIPWDVLEKLQKQPRNASASRQRSRCNVCGRAHAVLSKFGLCRIHLRQYTMKGYVPGLRKASW